MNQLTGLSEFNSAASLGNNPACSTRHEAVWLLGLAGMGGDSLLRSISTELVYTAKDMGLTKDSVL